MIFGKYLRRLRQQQKISLRQLAAKTGLSHVNIHNIETGKSEPRQSAVAKFAEVFGFDKPSQMLDAAEKARGRSKE
jgi:transcriptional regulator with XRE-family HTH domain